MDNLQYFEKPLKTQNKNPAYCPYITVNNTFKNTPVPQPQTMNGAPLDKICVPNLSDRMYIPGFGLNVCEKNRPVHLNFYEKSECYSDSACTNKITNCEDPYMQN
jgi:hypothetical protein